MDYEFLVRTADNVEIILDVSIFWQITDLYKLVLVTQDPPEDICKFNYLLNIVIPSFILEQVIILVRKF
jgi:regulator of protease activity HflC (stomatin/prohibitin superfamily)